MKLLSVCLLVYNQAPEMERLLNSIYSQITPEVEVIIRDDSTDDECMKAARKFPGVRYFRGQKGGIDRTFLFLLEQAKGRFVWWVGDDDITKRGIGKVLRVIKNNDISFVWINYQIFNQSEPVTNMKEGIIDKDKLLENAGTGLGFCSAGVFKKSTVDLETAKKYIGGAWTSLYSFLSAISKGNCYYIKEPIVICYPTTSEEIRAVTVKNGEINNAAFEVFGVGFANLLWEFEGTFSRKAIRKTIKGSFGQTWRGMLVGWIGGWDTPKGKRWRMFKLFWSYPECWIALPIMLMPLWINKGLFRIYKVFFSHRKFVFEERLNTFFRKDINEKK